MAVVIGVNINTWPLKPKVGTVHFHGHHMSFDKTTGQSQYEVVEMLSLV